MLPSRSYAALLILGSLWTGACSDADAPKAPQPGSGGGAGLGGSSGTGASAGAGTAGVATSGAPNGGTAGTSGGGGPPLAGTAGNAGASGNGGAPAGGGAGTAGLAGSAGQGGIAGTSTAGSAGVASDAGAAGAGGTSAGSAGASGAGGGSAGASSFSCPSGPFAAPMVESTTPICENFDLRYSWNEGPAWVASQNAFFFTNFVAGSASGGDIIKYTPGTGCERFMSDVGCNGLAPTNDGNLLAACQQTRSVIRIDVATKQSTTVASTYMGMMLDTPNDLVQHPNGSIYFTNPTNELAGRAVGVGPAAFRIDPMGMLSMIGQGNCNGIALSPDQSKLYVILLGMWDLDAQGVPSNRESLFTSGDGIAVDCAGNVYANGNIFDAGGDNVGSWGAGTNLAFGGEDGKTVLVVGRGTALRELAVNVPGPP
jgi:sugar lactone lactonase YvrE